MTPEDHILTLKDLIEPQQIIFRYSEVKILLIISKIWVYQVNITSIIDPAIQVTPLLHAVISPLYPEYSGLNMHIEE